MNFEALTMKDGEAKIKVLIFYRKFGDVIMREEYYVIVKCYEIYLIVL